MDKIYLSPEAYKLLIEFSLKESPFSKSDVSNFSKCCINQLLEHKLIDCRSTDFDFSGSYPIPTNIEYSITEYGRAYIDSVERNNHLFDSVQSIAESATVQAEIATRKAKKADVKGWIALIVSILALAINFIDKYSVIIEFF